MRQHSNSHVETALGAALSGRPEVDARGLFIVGHARTGTSILLDALNSSADVYMLGEANLHLSAAKPNFVAWYNDMHRQLGNPEYKATCFVIHDRMSAGTFEILSNELGIDLSEAWLLYDETKMHKSPAGAAELERSTGVQRVCAIYAELVQQLSDETLRPVSLWSCRSLMYRLWKITKQDDEARVTTALSSEMSFKPELPENGDLHRLGIS